MFNLQLDEQSICIISLCFSNGSDGARTCDVPYGTIPKETLLPTEPRARLTTRTAVSLELDLNSCYPWNTSNSCLLWNPSNSCLRLNRSSTSTATWRATYTPTACPQLLLPMPTWNCPSKNFPIASDVVVAFTTSVLNRFLCLTFFINQTTSS